MEELTQTISNLVGRMQTVLGVDDFDELFELRHEDDDA